MTTELQPGLGIKAAIEQRRAARAFGPDPIPQATLIEILRLGLRAPSGFNLQPRRFVLVQASDNKAKLSACAFDQSQITDAPVVLICCGDRQVHNPEYIESVIGLGSATGAMTAEYADYLRSSIPGFFANKPSFTSMEAWTNRHVMIAVAHVMLAAKSFGVDSCPMEGFNAYKVKAAFSIPETIDVCCLLPLGYATDPIKPYGGRFSWEQVCYGETFGQTFES